MVVWYHGTDPANVGSILEKGFKAGTYFARDMGSALHFGGNVIFEVVFDAEPTTDWQYVCSEVVEPRRIRLVFETNPRILYRNHDVQGAIMLANFREEHGDHAEICPQCRGRGQDEDYPPFVRWRDNLPVTRCKGCEGHGYQLPCVECGDLVPVPGHRCWRVGGWTTPSVSDVPEPAGPGPRSQP